ncbi:hypothetical protein LI328DRAFT_109174 [Trichoderma asperelloides]|nr:hypothetical protein LI328DRAFT_109174 [Trichoderma asperelloides]
MGGGPLLCKNSLAISVDPHARAREKKRKCALSCKFFCLILFTLLLARPPMFAFCRPTLEGNSFFADPLRLPSTWILTFLLPSGYRDAACRGDSTTVRCFSPSCSPKKGTHPLCRCGCAGKGNSAIQRHLVQWRAPPRAGRQCIFHSKGSRR